MIPRGPLHPFRVVGGAIQVIRTPTIRVYRVEGVRRVELPLPIEDQQALEREGALIAAYEQLKAHYAPADAIHAAFLNVDGNVTDAQEEALRALP